MNDQLNLIYAMQEGELVSISEVERGLQCNCTCPACNAQLVARRGIQKRHHFAHYKADPCKYGYETALHMAAKKIIEKAGAIWIPPIYLPFHRTPSYNLLQEWREIKIDKVMLEQRFGSIIPDIIIEVEGHPLIVEIFVTHAIDNEKLMKIKKANVSALEIDLSKMARYITQEELQHILLKDSAEKKWMHNALAKNWERKFFQEAADVRPVVFHGCASHVDHCPLAVRVWRGKPYANCNDDCSQCIFLLQSRTDRGYDNTTILCAGRTRIACMEDFSLSYQARVKKYEKRPFL